MSIRVATRVKKERWLPVVGFKGRYEVSDRGRVRSLHWGEPRVLAPSPHPGGYVLYHLYLDGKRKAVTAHRAVMEAFVGPRPKGMQIRHKDGLRQNNKLSNLSYGTPQQNADDKHRHGTALCGETSPLSKINTIAVLEIRRLRGKNTQQELADRFGITFSNVSAIQLRKSWCHV